jgi:hypothetical protein
MLESEQPSPVFIKIPDATAAYGIGVSQIYRLAKRGKLVLHRGAGPTLIRRADLEGLIEGPALPKGFAAGSPGGA